MTMMTFWVCLSCVALGFIGGHWVGRKENNQIGWIKGWTECNDIWLRVASRKLEESIDDK